MAHILGVDVGYSETKRSNSYCIVSVDEAKKTIGLIEEPECFCITDAQQTLETIFNKHDDVELVALDAPITPELMITRPGSGRTIERVFSKSLFSNGLRGPQPSSLSVPQPGWALYSTGMELVNLICEMDNRKKYISVADFVLGQKSGIIEIIPKLTQALLVPRASVIGRGKAKIDDYLFPRLFSANGDNRCFLDNALDEWKFTGDLEFLIDTLASRPKKYHEEFAAVVSAIQGAMLIIGKASVIGFLGANEGYYVLPQVHSWHEEWRDTFIDVKSGFTDIQII